MRRTMLVVATANMWLCPLGVSAVQEPPGPEVIAGTWNGRLEAPNLTIVIHIASTPDGKYAATMDSPDQGATGIPVGEVTFADSVLRFLVPVISGEYEGRLGSDGKITGEWRQGMGRLPLVLAKGTPAPSKPKPQEPIPPLPYDAEDVTFSNADAGIELAGTFTRPKESGPYPAVALITGSGPQDRNEALLGHKPFLVLADHLTRHGIAVLRYDDRGVGESGGDFATATSEDFATDALAAVAWLKQRREVDPARIGLVGHSEGGLVAPLAASRSQDIAFIVMMAGPGVTGEEILYEQGQLIARASGAPDAATQRNLAVQQRIFAIVKSTSDTAVSNPRMRDLIRASLDSLSDTERAAMGIPAEVDDYVEGQIQQVTTPWFRWFLAHDPAAALARVAVPVLAVWGGLDLQVPPQQSMPAVEAALAKANNNDVTLRVLPKLNHLFQTATTGAPSEYGRIEETISPEALQLMSSWIVERFGVTR